MALEDLRRSLARLGHTLASGWASLIDSAAGALTWFRPDKEESQLPMNKLPGRWGLLSADLYQDKDNLMLDLEIPGMEPSELDIRVDGNTLTVSGKKQYQQSRDEGAWHISECAYGAFERRFSLPEAVKADQAQANYRHGVLNLRLPLAKPHPKPRTIPISSK